MAAIEVETLCPNCLERYAPGTFDSGYPFCPECSSEGMDLDVVPVAEFLRNSSASALRERLAKFESRTGLLPEFKQLVLDRLGALIKEKERAL